MSTQNKIYSGKRGQGVGTVPGPVFVTDDNGTRPLTLRIGAARFAFSDLNWGYYGTGPQQLALALLADAIDTDTAARLAGRFKFDVIGGLPDSWTMSREDIIAWVEQETVHT